MTKAEIEHALKVVQLAIDIGELRTRAQTLECTDDPDGRIRAGYNVVGTETVRLSCYASPTGSGFNLQTVPDVNTVKPEGHPLRDGMRDLFMADEGCYLAQCDLKGADGWTIGAHLNALGDSSMIEDLKAGVKPAARVAYLLMNGNDSLRGKSRAEVKELVKTIPSDSWQYFASKQGIWGICYLMGPDLLAMVIAKQSEGDVWLTRTQVGVFRDAVFTAYRIRALHDAVERRLAIKPETQTSSGHRRRFFARKSDQLGQALAHEPQFFTTYATNLAMYRLWTDYDNRTYPIHPIPASSERPQSGEPLSNNGEHNGAQHSNQIHLSPTGNNVETNPNRTFSCKLKIEPIHQVHDALITQFRISDTEWATNQIKSYFNNPIVIAGQTITIPFDGKYGESWGNLKAGTI